MSTTTTELVPVGQYAPAVAESRTVNTLDLVVPAAELAERIARTNFVPTAFRGKPDELLACFLAGHELDVPPMTSMRLIHIVEGRPTFAAELMRAMVIAAGHDLWVEESNANSCTLAGRRRDWPADRVTRITWTMEDAKRAGLDRKNVWRAYPADMLLARATGRLVRATFPEVMAGLAVREEVEDGYLDGEVLDGELGDDGVLGAPDDAPPPPAKRTRKATTRKAKAPAKAASSPAPQPPLPDGDPAPAPAEASTTPAPDEARPPLPKAAAAQRPSDESAPQPTAEAENAAQGGQEAAESGPPPAPPEDEVAKKRAQRVVLTLREVGVEADEDRHKFLEWATSGRSSSAKDLTSEDEDLVRSVCGRITAGDLKLIRDAAGDLLVVDGEATSTEDDVAEAELPDEPEFDVDGDGQDDDGIEDLDPIEDADDLPGDAAEWRGWLRGLGLRVPDAIRQAQKLAGNLGIDSPGSLEDIAGNHDLAAAVAAWASAEAGR